MADDLGKPFLKGALKELLAELQKSGRLTPADVQDIMKPYGSSEGGTVTVRQDDAPPSGEIRPAFVDFHTCGNGC